MQHGKTKKIGIVFERSQDKGRTFGTPISLLNTGGGCEEYPQLVSHQNNVYVACTLEGIDTSMAASGLRRYHEYTMVVITTSKDSGATFDNTYTLTDIEKDRPQRPFMAASGSNVYLIWQDEGTR